LNGIRNSGIAVTALPAPAVRYIIALRATMKLLLPLSGRSRGREVKSGIVKKVNAF
jgi:hypothetical protein